jgi:hypothetical protein
MLARERGANPFDVFRVQETSRAARGLSPKSPASGREKEGPPPRDRSEHPDPAGALSGAASERAGGRHLEELLGVRDGAAQDVLGLYLAARSQQLGRRKFLCEIDGKVFSTMNLMRVHFERRYAADAEAWWNRHKRLDRVLWRGQSS